VRRGVGPEGASLDRWHHLAEQLGKGEVALAALEQEEIEAFVLEKIRAGASIHGIYPPDEATRVEFAKRRG